MLHRIGAVYLSVMRRLLHIGFFTGILFFVSHTAFAARLYLDPATTKVNQLDTVYVPVRLDTQGECINAVQAAVAYDPEVLSVRDVSISDSIISLWTEKPVVVRTEGREAGRVTFSGGIPGGYCGRVEGDPGQTDILVKLVVTGVPRALTIGEEVTAHLVVEQGSVLYRNDGLGTPVPLTFSGTDLVLVQSTSTPVNVWLGEVKSDTIAPELFEIALVKGPSVGNAKSYVVFSTVDKQSGVDHYEVLETDPDRFGFLTWVPREAHWVRAESPYVLRDQKLRSTIMVRAIDKNGNERTVEYVPPFSPLDELTRPLHLALLSILLLLIVGGAVFIVHRRRRGHLVP